MRANDNYYITTDKYIYESSDLNSWKKIYTLGVNGGALVILPSGEFFVFDYNSYALSTDKGENWTKVDQPGFSTRTVIADSLGYMYAGENDPVKRSTDKGKTWTNQTKGASVNFFDIGTLLVDPSGTIYAGNQGITGGMLYKSTNHGDSWKSVHQEQGHDIIDLGISPKGTLFLLSYHDKVIRSVDSAKTWKTVATISDFKVMSNFVFVSENEVYATLRGTGVIYSSDGGLTWDSTSTKLLKGQVNDLHLTSDGHLLAATTDGLYMQQTDAAVRTPEALSSTLKIYPSVASNDVQVVMPEKATEFSVYNALGDRVMFDKMQPSSSKEIRISVSTLPAGLYVARASGPSGSWERKILVRH